MHSSGSLSLTASLADQLMEFNFLHYGRLYIYLNFPIIRNIFPQAVIDAEIWFCLQLVDSHDDKIE